MPQTDLFLHTALFLSAAQAFLLLFRLSVFLPDFSVTQFRELVSLTEGLLLCTAFSFGFAALLERSLRAVGNGRK